MTHFGEFHPVFCQGVSGSLGTSCRLSGVPADIPNWDTTHSGDPQAGWTSRFGAADIKQQWKSLD